MPFVKRTIEPIRIGLNGGTVTECKNELQQVTAISLVDVMRQLSSLSMHVQDMFGELHREAALIVGRTLRLSEKVEYLRSEIGQLNPIVEEVSLQDINLRKPFKFSSLKDQQIITFSTRPYCISTVYASCEPPPSLQKLNDCRSDGKDSLKFYTDPGYFFELWCQAMQKESKSQMKKHKRGKKSGTIVKLNDEGQKWSLEKTQSKNKENISCKTGEQQKLTQKLTSTHASESTINKTSNSKQKTIPQRYSTQKAPKVESIAKPPEKVMENSEQTNKRLEQCAKECQTPEVKLSEFPKSKGESIVTESLKQSVPKSVEVIPTSVYVPLKQVDKFENCAGVLDLSNRNQNLYENAISLIPKENTYENALVLLNEYNIQSSEEHRNDEIDVSTTDQILTNPINSPIKTEMDQIDLIKPDPNNVEETCGDVAPDNEVVSSRPELVTSTLEYLPPLNPPGINRSKNMNLPPAPPTPPELYEGVKLNSDVSQLLEDVQKKTAAMNVVFHMDDDDEEELRFTGDDLKPDIFESIEEVLMNKVQNVESIDFSDLTDLPPIPSPPKFPPFMETSGISSPTSFPSPPTPAYNQHLIQMPQFDDDKESFMTIDIPNNNNNILETNPIKLGDETSVTSEISVVSSGSESSVNNSNTLNDDNSTGVIRDTRCDLLAAIREGIQLRKVEESRQKIERKSKPSGRLDVQSIMEVAFEMRRKMLEEDDSEEDEEGFETNWSDDD